MSMKQKLDILSMKQKLIQQGNPEPKVDIFIEKFLAARGRSRAEKLSDYSTNAKDTPLNLE